MTKLKDFLKKNGIELHHAQVWDNQQRAFVPTKNEVINAEIFAHVAHLLNSKLNFEVEDSLVIPGIQGVFALKLKSKDVYLYCTFERALSGKVKIFRIEWGNITQDYCQQKNRIIQNAQLIKYTPEVETTDEFAHTFTMLMLRN